MSRELSCLVVLLEALDATVDVAAAEDEVVETEAMTDEEAVTTALEEAVTAVIETLSDMKVLEADFVTDALAVALLAETDSLADADADMEEENDSLARDEEAESVSREEEEDATDELSVGIALETAVRVRV